MLGCLPHPERTFATMAKKQPKAPETSAPHPTALTYDEARQVAQVNLAPLRPLWTMAHPDWPPNWQYQVLTGRPVSLVVKLTQALAREWLQFNTHNRPINRARVNVLKDALINRRWIYDATPIRFSTEGVLLDGQKRLTAVAELNDGQRQDDVFALVAFNLAPPAQLVMDGNEPRLIAQTLQLMQGYEWVTKEDVAIVSFSMTLYRLWDGLATADNVKNFIDMYNTPLRTLRDIIRTTKGAGKLPSASCTAIFHALTDTRYRLYRILEFVAVISSGMYSSKYDMAGAHLARMLLRTFRGNAPAEDRKRRGGRQTNVARRTLYGKTESALWYFLRFQPLDRLYESNELWFPRFGPDLPVPNTSLPEYDTDEKMQATVYLRKRPEIVPEPSPKDNVLANPPVQPS